MNRCIQRSRISYYAIQFVPQYDIYIERVYPVLLKYAWSQPVLN